MHWKILSFVILIVLTPTLLAYDISIYGHYDLYMMAGKYTRPFPSWLNYTTLDNVSYSERSQIINYLKAGNIIKNYIKVSDDLSPIREWAESMYETNGAQFHVKIEDDYYYVYLWRRKAYFPSEFENNVNMILNLLTFSLWIVFLSSYMEPSES